MTRQIYPILLMSFLVIAFFSSNNYSSFAETTKAPILIPDSPLKQIKAGILSENIMCMDGLARIIKLEDGSPACVKPSTLLRLTEIKWGYIQSPYITNVDLLNSTITNGGKILEFKFDWAASSILITMQTTDDGTLTITIPKVLTDFMSWDDHHKSHGLLINGKMAELHETSTSKGTIITTPFHNGTKIIEIIATN